MGAVREHELEGVANPHSGRYLPGERGWVKVKNRDYWRYEREVYASKDSASIGPDLCLLLRMERTGIEPVTSGLQIPGFEARFGQIRLVNVKLPWLCEVEIGYSGTRFGTRFWCAF
jgi:hypothetical protein